jgi:transcriptional regulator with XRE-family HTH domain
MDQFNAEHLFQALRRILKEKKISYKELAKRVDLSEGTIKNMFHFRDASVQRLCEISNAIGVPFPDLMSAAYSRNTREFSFTEAQEQFFGEHPEHYNFFREVFFARKTPEEVGVENGLTQKSLNRYLKELENQGLLDRLVGGKLHFNFSGRLKWRHGGPWMRKYFRNYSRKISDEILAHPDSPDHFCSFSYATLSRANRDLFYLEIQEIIEKYKDVAYKEHLVESKGESLPVTWLVGMVPTDIVSHREDVPNLDEKPDSRRGN